MSSPSRARPLVAVAHGPGSIPILQLVEAASALSDLVWVVDASDPETTHAVRLLRRFGPVVDIGGLDPSRAARAIGEHHPDGLVTYFDHGMVALAEIADELGLPFHTPLTAEVLVDKAGQRRALNACGLEVPRCWIVPPGAVGPALAGVDEQASWPAVLKPRSGSGSRHAFLASDAAHARRLLEDAGEDREAMVLEEYLVDSPAFASGHFASFVSVESLASRGTLSHLAVTGRLALAEPFRETGSFIPAALEADQQREVLETAEAALRCLDVRQGCVHTEVKLTPDGPRIIEVNGRLGGAIPRMLERAAGLAVLPISLRLAAGEHVVVDGPLPCDRVAYHFFVQPPQIIAEVETLYGVETIAHADGVEAVSLQKGPGSSVDWRDGTSALLLELDGAASDHAGLEVVDDLVRRELKVTYTNITPDADHMAG